MGKKLKDWQAQAEGLGIALQDADGKDKTIAVLAAEIADKESAKPEEKPEDDGAEPADAPAATEIETAAEEVKAEEVKAEDPKKKSAKSGSALEKAHFDAKIGGENKLFPFSKKTLSFDKKDVVEVTASNGKVITLCLTPLRHPDTLGNVSSYLNNKRGISVQQAGQIIADCILSLEKVK